MQWESSAKYLNLKTGKIVKLSEPILTRWWTVGEAAIKVVMNLSILRRIAEQQKNIHPSGKVLNTIASSILSLLGEATIVSDMKLIAGYHEAFLNPHFAWLQKGDKDIGNTPGFLGRHMLSRYYLMWSDLKGLVKGGWKNHKGMRDFANSLKDKELQVRMTDPTDSSKAITQMEHQLTKVELFLKAALKSIEKHFSIFSNKLLFLSLYGEQYSSQVVAKILLGQDDCSNNDIVFNSEIHGRNININGFREFVKLKVGDEDVAAQMQGSHIQKLKADLGLLAGGCVFSLKFLCNLCVVNSNHTSFYHHFSFYL